MTENFLHIRSLRIRLARGPTTAIIETIDVTGRAATLLLCELAKSPQNA